MRTKPPIEHWHTVRISTKELEHLESFCLREKKAKTEVLRESIAALKTGNLNIFTKVPEKFLEKSVRNRFVNLLLNEEQRLFLESFCKRNRSRKAEVIRSLIRRLPE